MSDEKKSCKGHCCSSESCEVPQPHRRRGLTSVTLQWLAEKFRRAERIKDQLNRGTYEVDTGKVAQAILNTEGEKA